MKLLSIITAVHNQIEYNRLFLESLEKYTFHPYELIIIDNGSHDGSGALFAGHGATVLKNAGNPCYACCQNQGLEIAGAPYAAFLNNDICLSKHWDKKLIGFMERLGLDAISPSGVEMMEDERATRKAMRRWRRINAVQRLRAGAAICVIRRQRFADLSSECTEIGKTLQKSEAGSSRVFYIPAFQAIALS